MAAGSGAGDETMKQDALTSIVSCSQTQTSSHARMHAPSVDTGAQCWVEYLW